MNSEENLKKRREKAQDVILLQPRGLESSFTLLAEHIATKTRFSSKDEKSW